MSLGSHEIRPDPSEFSFSYSRSSGPGGQNVNKVNSRCQLRWNPATSRALSPTQKDQFFSRYGSRLNQEGELVITSDRTRSQLMNRDDCVEKLYELLSTIAVAPTVRKATRPSKGAKRRRLGEKRLHGDKKRARRSNPGED